MNDKPKIEFVTRCSVCGNGRVDKYEHVLKCRDCGALGDLTTWIMVPIETLTLKEEK